MEKGTKGGAYAVLTYEKGSTYGNIKRLDGLAGVSLSPAVVIRQRNIIGGYGTRSDSVCMGGYAGTISVMSLPISFYTDILDYTYENGILTQYGKRRKPVHFALMYETKEVTRDGLIPRRKLWYDCICTGYPESIETIAEGIGNTEGLVLSIEAYPRIFDGKVKRSVLLTENPSEFAGFYEGVE